MNRREFTKSTAIVAAGITANCLPIGSATRNYEMDCLLKDFRTAKSKGPSLLYPYILAYVSERTRIQEPFWLEFCDDLNVTDEDLAKSSQPPISASQTLADWRKLPDLELRDHPHKTFKRAVCVRNSGVVYRFHLIEGGETPFLWTMLPS